MALCCVAIGAPLSATPLPLPRCRQLLGLDPAPDRPCPSPIPVPQFNNWYRTFWEESGRRPGVHEVKR